MNLFSAYRSEILTPERGGRRQTLGSCDGMGIGKTFEAFSATTLDRHVS